MAINIPIIDNRPKPAPLMLDDFTLRLAQQVVIDDGVESTDKDPDPRAKVIRGALTLYHQMLMDAAAGRGVRRVTRGYFRIGDKELIAY